MKRLKSLKKHLLLPFGISVAAGSAVCAAVTLLCSLLMSIVQLPVEWGGGLGLFSLTAGCLTAGYVLGRKKKKEGIKQGFLCGAALLLISLLLGIFFGELSFWGIIGKALICIAAGITGGVAGVNSK